MELLIDMRGDIKGDHLIIYVRNIKTIGLIFIFMVLTILYYFLRFQFDQPALVAIAQVSLLSLLALLALWGMVSGKYRFIHILDYMLLLLLTHAILFCAYVPLRDGLYGAAWAVVSSLLPILVYFYVSNVLSPEGGSRVLILLEFILLTVAIIFIAEFINNHVLNQGFFKYTDLMYAHAQSKGSIKTHGAWAQGDLYRYIRMAGPLSHNNTTGVALALGLVLSVSRYITTHKVLTTVPFVLVFFVALILGGGRTSLIAGLIGSLTAVFFTTRISLAKILPKFILVLVLLMAILSWMIATEVIDPSAFNQVYNTAQATETLVVMVTVDEIQEYFERVTTFPFVLLSGLGPVTPTTSSDDLLSPVPSEDIFIVELLSQYGIVLPFLLAFAVWVTFRKALVDTERHGNSFLRSLLGASFGCVIVFVVSSSHTNAMIKPQLFPIFFIFLAIISIVRKAPYHHSADHHLAHQQDMLSPLKK